MRRLFVAAAVLGAWVALGGSGSFVAAARPGAAEAGVALAQTDLDQFMRQVLAKRDENWKKLQQYVLDEHEKIDVIGPQLAKIVGTRRDYRWYIKEGYFVRSPTSVDGVPVTESERRQAEDLFLRQAKEREARDAERAKRAAETAAEPGKPADADAQQPSSVSVDGLLSQTRQPQFITTAYFLRFKFEEGKYALVGREQFGGRTVLRVEYYPARLFSDTQDRAARGQADPSKPKPDRRQDLEVERLMNKNSLVTLWVEPAAQQIVKFVFDNVQTDFLPISWFFRLEDLKASMTMSQPFKDVWLPHDVDLLFSAMLAVGKFDIRYHLDYADYQEATASGRIIRGGGK